MIYFISILIGENTQSRVDVKLAHFFPILKKPERKKMAFRAEVLANQIAIIKSIDRDSSRWRWSTTGSAYLDNRKTGTVEFCHINRAKTLFFFFFCLWPRHVRTNCSPSTDDKRRRNFHCWRPCIDGAPFVMETSSFFNDTGFPSQWFVPIRCGNRNCARCQVTRCVFPSKVIPR